MRLLKLLRYLSLSLFHTVSYFLSLLVVTFHEPRFRIERWKRMSDSDDFPKLSVFQDYFRVFLIYFRKFLRRMPDVRMIVEPNVEILEDQLIFSVLYPRYTKHHISKMSIRNLTSLFWLCLGAIDEYERKLSHTILDKFFQIFNGQLYRFQS